MQPVSELHYSLSNYESTSAHSRTPALPHSLTKRFLERQPSRLLVGWIQIVALFVWILHPWSISRADEPDEVWTFYAEQTSLSVGATVVGSSHPMNPFSGQSRTIRVTPTLTSWGYYQSNYGHIQNDAVVTVPAPQAWVTSSISPSSDIGSSGYLDITFTPDFTFMPWVTIPIDITSTDSSSGSNIAYTAHAELTFTPPAAEDETWTKESDQSTMVTSIRADDYDLLPGETTNVYVHAEFQTWEVWQSDYDRTEIRNLESSPASGAVLSLDRPSLFSVPDDPVAKFNGPGTIINGTPLLDEAGNGWGTFTRGEGSDTLCRIWATAQYGFMGSSASIDIRKAIVQEVWTLTGTEGSITADMTADGSTTGVAPGATRVLSAAVTYESWEVWTSNLGHTEHRNHATAPAVGATVAWSVAGDASLNVSNSTTDSNGQSSASFTMGSGDAGVRADVSFVGCSSVSTSLGFSPPVVGEWVWDHNAASLSVSLNSTSAAATASMSGQISYNTWSVYRHTGTGATEDRDYSTGTAEGAQLSWSFSGDASASGDSSSTLTGGFNGSATLGVTASTITVTASFAGYSATASTDVAVCTLDSDGDGFTDAEEDKDGSDKNDKDSVPVVTMIRQAYGRYSAGIPFRMTKLRSACPCISR